MGNEKKRKTTRSANGKENDGNTDEEPVTQKDWKRMMVELKTMKGETRERVMEEMKREMQKELENQLETMKETFREDVKEELKRELRDEMRDVAKQRLEGAEEMRKQDEKRGGYKSQYELLESKKKNYCASGKVSGSGRE
jgi:hypothetical protein